MVAITPIVLSALWTGVKKNFQQGFDAQMEESFYRDFCTVVNSEDASETYDWLGDAPEMREWIGDRVIKDIKASGYQIANKDWEATIGVKATDIKDDKLGTYAPRFVRMGESAARKPDQLLSELMDTAHTLPCYDGQNFFDTEHPVYANHDGTGAVTQVSNMAAGTGPAWYLLDLNSVLRPFIFQDREAIGLVNKEDPTTSDHVFIKNSYLYGAEGRFNVGFGFWNMAYRSQQPLTNDTLDAAIEAMMGFEGDGGRPLGIKPTHLVVPTTLRGAARKVVKAQLGDGGATNVNFEEVELVVNSWLKRVA
ncbi:MAG: Mu-like prophage major head subunit gpT family protein [Pseudomonadota bacterium]